MVVETEQEIALRSYGSRLRFVQIIAALEILQNDLFHSGTSVVLLEDSSMTSHSFTTLTGGPCANICKTLNENEGGWNATGTKLGREPTHWTLASGSNASTPQM